MHSPLALVYPVQLHVHRPRPPLNTLHSHIGFLTLRARSMCHHRPLDSPLLSLACFFFYVHSSGGVDSRSSFSLSLLLLPSRLLSLSFVVSSLACAWVAERGRGARMCAYGDVREACFLFSTDVSRTRRLVYLRQPMHARSCSSSCIVSRPVFLRRPRRAHAVMKSRGSRQAGPRAALVFLITLVWRRA